LNSFFFLLCIYKANVSLQFAKLRNIIFLKDIFILSLTAFGGPNMHLALFIKRLVERKKYLNNTKLLEIYSLCQVLPGPTSTQTITGVGYHLGGSLLACLTLLVWVTPAFVLMTIFSIGYMYLDKGIITDMFRFIEPVAVSFVIVAAIGMVRTVAKDQLSIALIMLAFIVAALLRHPLDAYMKTPWIYPIVIVSGGVISFFFNREVEDVERQPLKIHWWLVVVFIILFVGSAILGKITSYRGFVLFENTFRFGSLVFGGGNVLLPMMYEQFVSHKQYFGPEAFLTGVGLVQAIPGPVFSFTTFASGLAMSEFGLTAQIIGSVVGTLGIFLPGLLIILFVYPIWSYIKKYTFIQRSLKGILSASAGLVAAAAYLFFLPVGLEWKEENNFFHSNLQETDFINWPNVIIILLFSVLLYKTPKIPAPVWILVTILAGVLMPN
jgi:chromate transporter